MLLTDGLCNRSVLDDGHALLTRQTFLRACLSRDQHVILLPGVLLPSCRPLLYPDALTRAAIVVLAW